MTRVDTEGTAVRAGSGARRPGWPDGRRRPSGLDAGPWRPPPVVWGWAAVLVVAAVVLLVLPTVRPADFDDARALLDGPGDLWRWLDRGAAA